MPESLLQVLKVILLAMLGLFFLRVLRAVWAEMKPPGPLEIRQAPATRAAPAARPASRDSALRLKVIEPPEAKGTTYELGDEVTVGRAPGCGVSLNDTTVSQLHARIFRDQGGKVWVEDLGSTNGTFLNRSKVSAPVAMRRGDRLQVGNTVLEVAR